MAAARRDEARRHEALEDLAEERGAGAGRRCQLLDID